MPKKCEVFLCLKSLKIFYFFLFPLHEKKKTKSTLEKAEIPIFI